MSKTESYLVTLTDTFNAKILKETQDAAQKLLTGKESKLGESIDTLGIFQIDATAEEVSKIRQLKFVKAVDKEIQAFAI